MSIGERGVAMAGYPTMLTRRRLLATTALMPLGFALAPSPAAAYGLVPELGADGRVTAWVNPRVMAALRAAMAAS